MPDNNNSNSNSNSNSIENRLAVVEQTFGLRTANNTNVAVPNEQPIQAQHTDNINWKALYKVLESEVEIIILDPNCPSYVKEWGNRVMDRLKQHLPT